MYLFRDSGNDQHLGRLRTAVHDLAFFVDLKADGISGSDHSLSGSIDYRHLTCYDAFAQEKPERYAAVCAALAETESEFPLFCSEAELFPCLLMSVSVIPDK